MKRVTQVKTVNDGCNDRVAKSCNKNKEVNSSSFVQLKDIVTTKRVIPGNVVPHAVLVAPYLIPQTDRGVNPRRINLT